MLHPDREDSVHGGSSNVLVCSRMESVKLQIIDPPISSSKSNVSPCSNNDIPDQDHSPPGQFSVLRASSYPVTLKFEDVAYSIKIESNGGSCLLTSSKRNQTRVLLNGVSGTARPGELLAMLGPSGSGKTTLLTALAGRLPGKFSGTVTYNGQPISSSVKRRIGFVTQDEVLYPHLTVLETLTYAALLRLPEKLTKAEKAEQAEMVIMELGLNRCRNSMIGGTLFRGVSGGERKRVSIGQEMLVNPSLLLLDEPTSGLDSTTAQRIVATLRWLARGGRTVVTTIHQPSSRLYRMFDKVLVLSEGCPIYSGKGSSVMDYFAAIGYVPAFNFMNPADFLLDLANGIAPDTRQDDQHELVGRAENVDNQTSTKQFLISCYKKSVKNEEVERSSHDSIRAGRRNSPLRSSEEQWTTSWWLQFTVLLSRGLKERRHESFSYNFSTDYILREQYRDPWNEVRIGKLLEDLDALAGTISVKHCSDEDSTTRPLYLVTASVDKMVLKKPISVDIDLKMVGAVIWVGRSSIEIQLDVIQPSNGSTDPSEPALTANFIFVARDYKTKKAAPVNRLSPETEEEKHLYEAAEARNKLRKSKRGGDKREIENGGVNRLEELLAEGRIFCDMPALADRNSILLRDTRLENSLICQPQQRNIHGRIFGGFLMHRAFELAFSTAYAFAGMMPSFMEVDHVDFLRPVDVGDFLRFKSCVLYTEYEHTDQPLINIEVVAHVTRPELRSSEVSNKFYFTFTVRPEAKAQNNQSMIRKVVPATEEEARTIIERMDADMLQTNK